MPEEDHKTKLQAIGLFFWDQKTGKCLGRTGESWLKIISFYIALYAILAVIWTLFFYMFQHTISDREPKWKLDESLIGTNPGLGFRPRNPPDRIDSALISYRAGKDGNPDHWIKDLNDYLDMKPRNASLNDAFKEDCSPTRDKDAYCPFDRSNIPPECSSAKNYSFFEGKPCILIKINRIYGWKPLTYESRPKHYPKEASFNPNTIQITCEGQNDIDKEHIGPIAYFPPFIESKYYPFLNQPGYQSPFVMVHFTRPKFNTLIFVECKAWAKNIEHERFNKRGSTSFELFIEKALPNRS